MNDVREIGGGGEEEKWADRKGKGAEAKRKARTIQIL
jgi:hypothetical protein